MTWLSWVLFGLWIPAGYLGYQVGQRVEKGRKEEVADRLAEERHQRGIRGTVRLSSMKIRR